MALTFVQQANNITSNTTFATIAYPSATTGSSYLLLSIQIASQNNVITVSDTLGNTWQLIQNINLDTVQFALYQVPINKVAGGVNTVNVSISGAAVAVILLIAEYTGQIGSGTPVDASSGYLNEPTSPFVFGPVTTAYTNEELIWFGWVGANITYTPAVGWAARVNNNPNSGAALADSSTLAAAVGSYQFSATASNSDWDGILISVKSTTSVPAVTTSGWSPVDCRDFGTFPNSAVLQNSGAEFYTGQTSSNPALPPKDSSPNLPAKDSRIIIPKNSRNNPPF